MTLDLQLHVEAFKEQFKERFYSKSLRAAVHHIRSLEQRQQKRLRAAACHVDEPYGIW